MQIIFVFLSLVIIWSTTPLTIVWSTSGSSFNFGVASKNANWITGVFAFFLLKDKFLSVGKIIGLFGLVFIFSHSLLNTSSLLISGLLAVTLAMAFQGIHFGKT